MANNRRSVIVDLLAAKGKPLSTKAIADALGLDIGLIGTRCRQLEQTGKLTPVGTATRTRDVRWKPTDPDVIARRPKVAVSYRAAENIDAMRAAALARLLDRKPADWMQESVNQCDGCRVSAPLTERGNHAMPDGGFMACSRDLYEVPR
jgi:hypothetical protein